MTPPPRINYSTTRQEALALGLEVAGNTDFARKFHRHGWWIFALIWFGVLLAKNWPLEHEHFMVNGQSAPGVVGIITLIIIGGTSILFGWITAKGLKHMASRYLEAKIRRLPDSNFTSERSIEASKDQLIIRFPDIERHYPWHAVKKLEAGSNYLSVVGANQRALVVIPTRSFPSPEAQSEFENFCRQKISGLAEQM